MTLKAQYNHLFFQLKEIYEPSEAAAIANNVLQHFGFSRNDIMADMPATIDENALKEITNRLLQKEPLQYTLGYAWFYELKFKVSPAVLIPRPETEELVEKCLYFCKAQNVKTIIDIGTGSGCIPITLKVKYPEAAITAMDISSAALEIAAQNAIEHNVEINFIESDFLQENNWQKFGKYDILISNPPYIPGGKSSTLNENVLKYEPHIALFSPDENPLVFYRKTAHFAKEHLTGNGKVFLETHWDNAHTVADIFIENGFDANVLKDMSGNDRIVIATRSHLP